MYTKLENQLKREVKLADDTIKAGDYVIISSVIYGKMQTQKLEKLELIIGNELENTDKNILEMLNVEYKY